MKNIFLLALISTLLLLSSGLRPPTSDSTKLLKQISDKFETALLSNDYNNTKSVVSDVLDILTNTVDLAIKLDTCQLTYPILKLYLEGLTSLPETTVAQFALIHNSFNMVNRACFPIVNFARKLLVGGAQMIGFNTTHIPEFQHSKIFSVDLSKSLAGKAVLVVDDMFRFTECLVSVGTMSLASLFVFADQMTPMDSVRMLSMSGFNMVKGCQEAWDLAKVIVSSTEKEEKVLKEVEKLSTALFADNKNEIELAAVNKTVSAVFETLRDIGYADLCTKLFGSAYYQYFIVFSYFPEKLLDPMLIIEFFLSMPYSANQDCLPIANAIKYAFVEAGNMILGHNDTFVPMVDGIVKKEHFGIYSNTTAGEILEGVGAGLETVRCTLASAVAVQLAGVTIDFVKAGETAQALNSFEYSILEALGGSTSCVNAYNYIRGVIAKARAN